MFQVVRICSTAVAISSFIIARMWASHRATPAASKSARIVGIPPPFRAAVLGLPRTRGPSFPACSFEDEKQRTAERVREMYCGAPAAPLVAPRVVFAFPPASIAPFRAVRSYNMKSLPVSGFMPTTPIWKSALASPLTSP